MASSELVLFDKSIDPETPVSVTVGQLRKLHMDSWNAAIDYAVGNHGKFEFADERVTVHERVCRDFGGEEGTVGEGYDFACSSCGFMSAQTGARFCPNCGARVVS